MAQDKPLWERQQIRQFVKSAIDRAGGKAAFRFVGPAVRRTIIEAECWRTVMICATGYGGHFEITKDQAVGFFEAMCKEAGIWEEV